MKATHGRLAAMMILAAAFGLRARSQAFFSSGQPRQLGTP